MKLILIDGNSLLFRAYHALPHLSTTKGQPTSAIYGFIGMLQKLLEEETPDMAGVVFDSPKPTFRHQESKEYKANRPHAPDELRSQVPIVKEIIEAYKIPIFELEGYEADDLIGTIAKRAEREGHQVLIVSGDLDTLQLVSSNVSVLVTSRGITETTLYDLNKVVERFGIQPELLPDFKALRGDPTDNIPGVPGIGDKRAVELIQTFGSARDVLDNLEKVPDERLRVALAEFSEQVNLSERLATIVVDLPLGVSFDSLNLKPPDKKKLRDIFRELEFRKFLKKLGEEEIREGEAGDYRFVKSSDELADLLAEVKRRGECAIVLKLSDLDPYKADVQGVAISGQSNEGFYVPVEHMPSTETGSLFGSGLSAVEERSVSFSLTVLSEILGEVDIKKYGHGVKDILVLLHRYDVPFRSISFDTQLAAYVLDPVKGKYQLDDMAAEKLDVFLGGGSEEISACRGASAVIQLKGKLDGQLAEAGLLGLFYGLELPLVEVLADMELAGVAVDVDYLADLSKEMGERLKRLEGEIYRLAGGEFNINSPKQLQEMLFNKLKLPGRKRIKSGYSTSAEVLESLRGTHEIIGKILDYRELMKLKGTYVDTLPKMVNPKTGRVHTSFNQVGTATGRLASSNPNLQNVPTKSELGRQIRRGFIAGSPSNWLLSADYSQIELRVLAHISGDENLIDAFKKDQDIHTFTACDLFGVKADEVTPEMRRKAKIVNFGIVYGISDFGLAKELDISQEEAREYIENYFKRFPRVKEYIEETLAGARELGYVSTLLSRRRGIPDIHSKNPAVRGYAERAAINTPIQGSAADIIKLAMINVHRELKRRNLQSKMILQVHDELLFEVPEDELKVVTQLVKEGMETAYSLNVPLKVDVKGGKNWLELVEIC